MKLDERLNSEPLYWFTKSILYVCWRRFLCLATWLCKYQCLTISIDLYFKLQIIGHWIDSLNQVLLFEEKSGDWCNQYFLVLCPHARLISALYYQTWSYVTIKCTGDCDIDEKVLANWELSSSCCNTVFMCGSFSVANVVWLFLMDVFFFSLFVPRERRRAAMAR